MALCTARRGPTAFSDAAAKPAACMKQCPTTAVPLFPPLLSPSPLSTRRERIPAIPLLYIYINELPLHIWSGRCDMLADDTTIHASGTDVPSIVATLHSCVSDIVPLKLIT